MNNKPEPKFVPGERVILASSSRPECNGVHSVIGVHYKEMPIDGVTGEICNPMFVYALDGAVSRWDGWAEHLLRKLPPNTPSTFEDCIFKPEKVTQ